jgi:putative hydrolase of the HAD superfamily
VEAARVLDALRGELRPQMVAAVRQLREAGLPLALLSNNVAPMERTGPLGELLALFDAVVESSTEGVRKPETEIYRRALTRLSEAVGRPIEAADCAYLDDLGINLKPARALGMHTIKVVEPAAALSELSELVGFRLDGAP